DFAGRARVHPTATSNVPRADLSFATTANSPIGMTPSRSPRSRNLHSKRHWKTRPKACVRMTLCLEDTVKGMAGRRAVNCGCAFRERVLSPSIMDEKLWRDLLIVNREIFDEAIAVTQRQAHEDIDEALREASIWASELEADRSWMSFGEV